ncbi:MAG: hypothetical protein R3A45_02645 [Bdellovibrionota bacterium]
MNKQFFLLIMLLFLSNRFVYAITPAHESVQKALQTNYDDCVFLGYVYHPKDSKAESWGFCAHKHTEVRGIFAASACVITLIEGQSQKRDPYYGKNGHWGLEGDCSAQNIERKFNEKQTLTTDNPITRLQELKQKGWSFTVLKDFGNIGATLEKILLKPYPPSKK